MNALADQLEERAAGTEVARLSQEETVLQAIERQQSQIALALPPGYTPERFTRTVMTAIKQTPDLQLCTAASMLGAVMLSAQLGLEPGPLGHCYLVPFRDHGVLKVTFITGYKGLVDLAYRSPRVESVVARSVHEGDEFSFEYGDDERIVHRPARGARGQSFAYYTVVRLVGGGRVRWVMYREEIEERRKRSKTPNKGPWVTDYDAMAAKTVLRAASPWIPKSVEFARALMNDSVVVESIDSDLADRVPDPNVIDVEGHEDDDPDPNDPRGTATPPDGGASEAASVDGAQSPSNGNAHAPSTAANNAEGKADTASVSGATANPSVETVNDDGAQMIGMWCADHGIGDDLRPAFLYAFSGGAYHRAHDVPVDKIADLRATLVKVKRGDLVLDVPSTPATEPKLRVPGDSSESAPSNPPPASVTWRAVLSEHKGIGQAKLLRRARDLAGELGVTLPTSLDDIDPVLNEPLRAWLEQSAAA